MKKLVNFFLIGLLLLMVFNPAAKAWLLQQLMAVGMFKAGIEPGHTTAPGVNFYYSDASGKTASLSDLKGKVVLINFWATWCPPCLAEMPSLDALYRRLKDDDRFVFLFVSEDEDRQKASQFVQQKRFAFPLYTRVGNVPPEIFSGTLPTTLVLNTRGQIVMKHEGLANYHTDEFLSQLKGLLQSPSSFNLPAN